jgi:hypothetical protein
MMPIRSLSSLATLLAMAIVGVPGKSDAATFTNRAVFEASLPAGNFFNSFSGVPDAFITPVASITQSGGTPTISYDITAPPANVGVFPDSGFKAIGNWNPGNDLVVTFTSGNVYSAGANFWLSDINGVRQAGSITVNFSDGTSAVVPSTTSGALGYLGLTSSVPLTSMTIVAASPEFLNFSNFSTAIPEPTTAAMLAGCVVAVGLGRRRDG